ncbi:unnamed protein product, partial [Prorocentrum cordatum]
MCGTGGDWLELRRQLLDSDLGGESSSSGPSEVLSGWSLFGSPTDDGMDGPPEGADAAAIADAMIVEVPPVDAIVEGPPAQGGRGRPRRRTVNAVLADVMTHHGGILAPSGPGAQQLESQVDPVDGGPEDSIGGAALANNNSFVVSDAESFRRLVLEVGDAIANNISLDGLLHQTHMEIGELMEHVYDICIAGGAVGLVFTEAVRSDETQFPARGATGSNDEGTIDNDLPGDADERAKLVNTEWNYGVLFVKRGSGGQPAPHVSFSFSLCTPVQVVSNTSGECYYAVLHQTRLADADRIAQKFARHQGNTTTDGDRAFIRAERHRSCVYPGMHLLHKLCCVHRASNCKKDPFKKKVPREIEFYTNLALVMRRAYNSNDFRREVKQLILAPGRFTYLAEGACLPVHVKRLEHLLDHAVQPRTGKNAWRRSVIWATIDGGIDGSRLIHWNGCEEIVEYFILLQGLGIFADAWGKWIAVYYPSEKKGAQPRVDLDGKGALQAVLDSNPAGMSVPHLAVAAQAVCTTSLTKLEKTWYPNKTFAGIRSDDAMKAALDEKDCVLDSWSLQFCRHRRHGVIADARHDLMHVASLLHEDSEAGVEPAFPASVNTWVASLSRVGVEWIGQGFRRLARAFRQLRTPSSSSPEADQPCRQQARAAGAPSAPRRRKLRAADAFFSRECGREGNAQPSFSGMWAKFRRLGDGDIDELQRQADEANAEVSEGGGPFPMGRREMQRARARADAEAVAAMHVRAQLADDRVGQPAPLPRALEAHGRTLAAVAAAAPSGALAARPSADALAVIERALRTSSDSERREEKVAEQQVVDFAERGGRAGARELALAAGRAAPHAAGASFFVADPRNAQSEEGAPNFLHAEWADDSVYQRAQRLAALTGQTRPVRALRGLLHRFWHGLSRASLHKDCEVFDEPPVHRRCWEARRFICCPESASLVKLKANLEKATRRLYRPGALRSNVDSGLIVCCFIGLAVRHDGDGGPAAECDDGALYAFMHVGFHSWSPFEPFYVPMRTPGYVVDLDGDQKLRERLVELEALPRSLDAWAACEIFDLSKRWLLAHFELIENDTVVGA